MRYETIIMCRLLSRIQAGCRPSIFSDAVCVKFCQKDALSASYQPTLVRMPENGCLHVPDCAQEGHAVSRSSEVGYE